MTDPICTDVHSLTASHVTGDVGATSAGGHGLHGTHRTCASGSRPAPLTVDAALVQLEELGYSLVLSMRIEADADWRTSATNKTDGRFVTARGKTPLSAHSALVTAATLRSAMPS